VRSAWKLAATTLRADALLWTIAAVMTIVTVVTGRELVLLFLAGGFLPVLRDRLPRRAIALAVPLVELLLFFSKAGAFVFGSGLAIVPFLYGEVVQGRGWLTERQFLDAVAVAMITPGPVVISVAFIGYLIGRERGMSAATIGVFLPAWVIVAFGSRHFRAIARREGVRSFVAGVTASATGAMAGAAIVLGRRAIIDIPTTLLAIASLAILTRTKLSELWLIAASAAIGMVLR